MSESQLLTTPVKIGTLDLLNRVVMAPLTRARSDPDTRGINAQNVLYYSQRAGTGLIITEATAISAQGYGWYGAPALYTDEHAKKWVVSDVCVYMLPDSLMYPPLSYETSLSILSVLPSLSTLLCLLTLLFLSPACG
jgi:hypothetical protein